MNLRPTEEGAGTVLSHTRWDAYGHIDPSDNHPLLDWIHLESAVCILRDLMDLILPFTHWKGHVSREGPKQPGAHTTTSYCLSPSLFFHFGMDKFSLSKKIVQTRL